MKLWMVSCAILLIAVTVAAQSKDTIPVATIRFREAMLGTKEGRRAVTNLQARFAPRKAQLENRQKDIAAMSAELRSGGLNREQREDLERKMAQQARDVERTAADLEADARHETEVLEKLLAERLDAFLAEFAAARGLVMVLDSAAPGNAVRWVKAGMDITADVIEAYDATAAGGA